MDLALARHPQTVLGHAAGLAEGAGDLWGWWGERHSLLVLVLQSRLVLLLQDGLLCNAAMQLLLRLTKAAKLSLAASATKEEQKCDASRIAVVCVELFASPASQV